MNEEKFRELVEDTKECLINKSQNDDKYEIVCSSILDRQDIYEEDIKSVCEVINRTMLTTTKEASILTPFLEDDEISEIMVNGADNIFVEKRGIIQRVNVKFFDDKELEDLIRRIGSSINREINENMPILDARLKDGSRVSGVYKNLTDGKCILTIRKFLKNNITLGKMIEQETISKEAVEFLEALIDKDANVFICGGTSSGKTTMLSALMELLNKTDRVITIEDSREIQIENIENLVQLECRQVSDWSKGNIGMGDLIKASLRMRPDKLIIGEIRDGKALLNMLNGLNTGHSGMSTGHSNSCNSMIKRMESLYMQESNFPIESIDEQIVTAIDIIINMARDKGGSRYVKEIGELILDDRGRAKVNNIFIRKDKHLERTNNTLKRVYEI